MSLNRPRTNRNREVILIHVHSRDLERFKLDTTFRPAESPQKNNVGLALSRVLTVEDRTLIQANFVV